MSKRLGSLHKTGARPNTGGVSRLPKTFVFDANLPQEEYHKYISPENIISENVEVATKVFSNYRSVITVFLKVKVLDG